ncbi:Protein unc-79 [Saguinus oedipus]|uniref:Protein unc-79 n=1 Tax=Saguinus oedipus TaxID=9490 RepID=A0ABQ9V7L5_SAGOE|nr:Protein unc-79 [Saguinus oedipus]
MPYSVFDFWIYKATDIYLDSRELKHGKETKAERRSSFRRSWGQGALWPPARKDHIRGHLSAGLQLRLQAIQNHVNHHSLRTLPGSGQSSAGLAALRKWLQCTQFKMAQVEIQSSEAASQFYPL